MQTQTKTGREAASQATSAKREARASARVERREKKEEALIRRAEKRRHAAFCFCRAFRHYCFFLLFALIFTQALRSPISGMLFVFALILPVISFIYALVARLTVSASTENDVSETVKGSPVRIRMAVRNGSILPLPFVEAFLLVPDEAAVRCRSRLAHLTLMPRSTYTYERLVSFPYCGEYVTGISEIYVSDPLRLFRIRISMGLSQKLFVAPYRTVMIPDGQNAISDLTTETTSRRHGGDRTEVTEIRDYRMGDQMKDIHWKLSSKTEDLQVREFGINVGKSAFIICDPSRQFDLSDRANRGLYADDINEYAADAVIGAGIAAAAREIEDGNSCTFMWFDSRSAGGIRMHTLESRPDLDAMVHGFASTPLLPAERTLGDLLSLIGDTQGVSVLYITSRLNEKLVHEMTDAAVLFHQIGANGAVSLYDFDVSSKITDAECAERFRAENELCRALLTGSGVNVYDAMTYVGA